MKLNPVGANVNVLSFGDTEVLFSYSTPVAAFVPGRGYLRTEKFYSVTTSKHINKWLDGIEAIKVSQSSIDELVI